MKDYSSFISDLKSIIAVKSTAGEKKDGAPFGEEPRRVLDLFLSVAEKMGFKTINYDGYAGEVIFGSGEEIGIIGHLDVVPEGDGWNTPPYSLTEKDGFLIGRGVMDDKGPTLLCLYALKELKDSGIVPKKKFRLIVGTNEETGWRDIEHLNKKTSLPEYCFSPDGDFPVVYAEKGMAEVIFSLPKLKNFSGLKGGTVVNAVCATAEILPKDKPSPEILDKYGLSFDGEKIISVGKSAHGSRPEDGKNALSPLLSFLADCGENVQNVIDCIFNDKYGVFKTENEQGKITLSAGVVSENENGITLTSDLRVPAPFTFKTATDIIDEFGIPYKLKIRHEPHFLNKDDGFVKTLLSSYKKATGDENARAISQSGCTFARAFKKGCAFGPELPDSESTIHAPNERISKKDLLTTYEIYKSTIFDLSR